MSLKLHNMSCVSWIACHLDSLYQASMNDAHWFFFVLIQNRTKVKGTRFWSINPWFHSYFLIYVIFWLLYTVLAKEGENAGDKGERHRCSWDPSWFRAVAEVCFTKALHAFSCFSVRFHASHDWGRKAAQEHRVAISGRSGTFLASGTGILNAIFGFHRLRPDGHARFCRWTPTLHHRRGPHGAHDNQHADDDQRSHFRLFYVIHG